jgi:serine/threonine-protein kinase
MAEVYFARRAGPHGFQKIVAVKRILPQYARDIDFKAMFVDEARVCARLGHPNIVQVFDLVEQNGELYMAMEYVDGTTGARLIREAAAQGEEIPLEVSLHIALSVLRALEYAHGARDDEGRPLSLVHRDVSPGNVLIDRSGAVKLTDFGIARAAEIERRTDAGQLKGKLGYMSPEQVVGRELDARSDLFTLGIVLAEMVILRPLFSGGKELDVLLRIRDADLTAIDRASRRVPDDVRAGLYRALARDPYLRYPSATAFAAAIEEIIRRRRLQTGPSRLAAYVEKLGLVQGADEGVDDADAMPATSTVALELNTSTRRALRGEDEARSTEAREVAPQIYRLRLGSGAIVGPMSYARLVEHFVTGIAGVRAEVSRESGRFKPARDFPELSRILSSPALRWEATFPEEVSEPGPIEPTRLPSQVFQLALRRETGALLFRDGARQKKIYLVDGYPELVVSTDKRELLGEYLVARGQVLRVEAEMALAMLPRFGGRVGDALVGLGVLRPVELFRAIHDQIEERFVEAFTWRSGEWGFVRGARSHEETFPLGIDPFELIARGIRHAYATKELAAVLHPLRSDPLERVSVPPVRMEQFRLPDHEALVWERVRGKMTLTKLTSELAVAGLADADEVMRAVFLGLSCGLLRSPRWEGAPVVARRYGG